MIRRPGLLAAGLLAGGVAVSMTRGAAADWPMSRQNAQRTAAAKGKSNITTPEPTWRFPLGGTLYYTQQLIDDADGDGVPELYFVRGSNAVGKRIDDSQMWSTPSMGVNAMLALADLDGSGGPELVITVGTNQVAVIDALSGEVDWTNPATEIGARGTVLVGDLTDDGLPEVLIQDCGCCAEKGAIPGAVYTFADNAKSPTLLWELPYASCGGGNSTTLLDADGDGRTEVLFSNTNGFELLDGATGSLIASVAHGPNYQVSQCVPAHITGAREQAVCVLSNGTSNDSGHRIFALGYETTPTPALTVLWDQKLGYADGQINLKPGMVADLDGDGQKEVVITAATAPGTWATYVLDALGGAVLATLDGHKLIGTAPVVSGGRGLILTEETDGFGAWSFQRSPAPAISPRWLLSGQAVLNHRDFAMSMRSSSTIGLLAIDLTGDGTPDLVTSGSDGTIRVLDTSQGTAAPPPVAAMLTAPQSWGNRFWADRTNIDGTPTLVTDWSDGAFRMHKIVNGALTQVGGADVHFDGFFSSGYWRSQEGLPIVASLGPGQPDSVIVTDATRNVHVLDVSQASATTPPVERWSIPRASSPIVVPGLNGGAPGVAILQRVLDATPTKQEVIALDADGKPLWSSQLDGIAASDLLAGNLDGDGVPDIVASWNMSNESPTLVHTRAISGASGSTLWDGQTYPDALMSGASLHDWDGDGRDDVFSQSVGLLVLSGASGAKISPPPAETAQNAMPMLADGDGDGKPEVVLQGGYARVTILSSDLTQVLYKSDEVQSTILYGALARCPGGARLVESTYFYHTSRLALTELTPPQVGKTTAIYLAGGKVFADEAAAIASGAFLGGLTAVSVHEDLTGLGRPSAVVGSNDGWLYAVDPCTGTLDFAYEFKDAVGAVAFGDTDGDGLDEMIVEVSDGFVYGMKQFDPGTGGSGGTGTTSSAGGSGGVGGAGGTGGASTGGSATGGAPTQSDEYLLYGRACTCTTPDTGDETPIAPLLAGGLAALVALRRRRRSSPVS